MEASMIVLEHADFGQILQRLSLVRRVKKIISISLVDLEIGNIGLKLRVGLLAEVIKEITNRARNETSICVPLRPACQSKRLPRTYSLHK